jgi:ferredoxin
MSTNEAAPATQTFTLDFPELDREIASHDGETIFQSARRSGVRIIGACGGRGACGTCRVLIVEGEIDEAGEKSLQDDGAAAKKPRWVRACQVTPRSDCTVEIAARSLAPIVRAEFDAGDSIEILALDATVVSQDVSVPEATLVDNLSDLDRVIRALATPLPAVDLAAARQLPAALRGGDWSLRTHIRDHELIGFRLRHRPRRRPRHHQCRRFPGRSAKRRARRQSRHRKPAGGVGRRRHQSHESRHARVCRRRGLAAGGQHRDQRARP